MLASSLSVVHTQGLKQQHVGLSDTSPKRERTTDRHSTPAAALDGVAATHHAQQLPIVPASASVVPPAAAFPAAGVPDPSQIQGAMDAQIGDGVPHHYSIPEGVKPGRGDTRAVPQSPPHATPGHSTPPITGAWQH
ncbi:hypothetical protein CPLU01_01290 [Colletotrichum plurivorum]|uniref:Uncharacterized protein n=1 Tax=Colletotrichum plurivorum TaxID=2175906 RepID=A0A8H6U4J4_9PEZI|nr:hypothetical protein CPLU01_01290 [Colletotrichum plurivorum]